MKRARLSAQRALVRPKTFILTCADGNALFGKLSWTSWTPGLASAKGSYTGLTEILTGPRPRYYDAIHHKWVTAPVTQTTPLLTSPTALSPGALSPGA